MPEIIAEISSNWRTSDNQDKNLNRALTMIEIAANCGASTVKFQLFKADQLYSSPKKVADLKPYELPEGWLPDLYAACEDNGISFLCTPFYIDAIDELRGFQERWKIASPDIIFVPMLKELAQSSDPILLSTGFSYMQEIQDAIDVLTSVHENREITLLHCTGGYPTPIEEMNMRRLLDLGEHFFPHRVGFSSHTPVPYLVASSVLYGAEVIEVHFDLEDRKGIETRHSFDPKQLGQLVKMAREFESAKTCGCDMPLSDTVQRKNARRNTETWLR